MKRNQEVVTDCQSWDTPQTEERELQPVERVKERELVICQQWRTQAVEWIDERQLTLHHRFKRKTSPGDELQ